MIEKHNSPNKNRFKRMCFFPKTQLLVYKQKITTLVYWANKTKNSIYYMNYFKKE